jgi:hypothetical protein
MWETFGRLWMNSGRCGIDKGHIQKMNVAFPFLLYKNLYRFMDGNFFGDFLAELCRLGFC